MTVTWSGDCHYYRYYYCQIWRLSLLPLLLLPDRRSVITTVIIITCMTDGDWLSLLLLPLLLLQIWRLSLLPLLLLPDLATVITTVSYCYLIWRLTLLPLLLLPDLATVITTVTIITRSGDCHYYRYYYYQTGDRHYYRYYSYRIRDCHYYRCYSYLIWRLSLLPLLLLPVSGDCHYYRYYYYRIWQSSLPDRLSLLPLLLDLATVITTVVMTVARPGNNNNGSNDSRKIR